MEPTTVLGVKEFVAALDLTLQFGYANVTVEGEISALKVTPRVVYFTLKEGEATLRSLLFRTKLEQPLEDGMKVRAIGTPRLHAKFGFSFNVERVELAGEGELKRAFELLKAQLEAEGLFAPARKRPLPQFPARIGLITSPESAAYHDFGKILGTRWRGVSLLVYPVQVQGRLAVKQIVSGLKYFNELSRPADVVVIIRGGGSLEDLTAFNSESVARAVAASRTPTVVGVGHEVDVTLADLAADVRAATPTQAAQLVVPDRAEVGRQLERLAARLVGATERSLVATERRVERCGPGLMAFWGRPRRQVETLAQRLRQYLDNCVAEIQTQRLTVGSWERLLLAASPERVLARGYSITYKDGNVVRSSGQVRPGDRLVIQLAKGKLGARADGQSD